MKRVCFTLLQKLKYTLLAPNNEHSQIMNIFTIWHLYYPGFQYCDVLENCNNDVFGPFDVRCVYRADCSKLTSREILTGQCACTHYNTYGTLYSKVMVGQTHPVSKTNKLYQYYKYEEVFCFFFNVRNYTGPNWKKSFCIICIINSII